MAVSVTYNTPSSPTDSGLKQQKLTVGCTSPHNIADVAAVYIWAGAPGDLPAGDTLATGASQCYLDGDFGTDPTKYQGFIMLPSGGTTYARRVWVYMRTLGTKADATIATN